MNDGKNLNLRELAKSALDKALKMQQQVAIKNVERLRRVHPEKSPADLIDYINRAYLVAVTAGGAGAGAAAVVPNAVVQIPVGVGEALTFLEASVLYTLSVAEVHDVDLEDVERRRLLVMSVLLGDSAATSVLEPFIGKVAPYWGKKIVKWIPMQAIDAANKALTPHFITKWGTKQGVLVLGKQLPLAIGVGVGAIGNHVLGRFTVKAAKMILGPPPQAWSMA